MEDIDLKELFMIFWNKKIQIILFIILFAIIGGIYTIGFIKPMYTASTTLVLATSSGENTQDATNSITTTDVTLNSKLVSTYSELVKSKKVLRKVISNLNIDVKEESLRKNITVSSVKDTELIEITVSNEEPIYATQIANEIANVFSEEVNDIYNINNIHVVDTAEIPKEPSREVNKWIKSIKCNTICICWTSYSNNICINSKYVRYNYKKCRRNRKKLWNTSNSSNSTNRQF